MGAPDPRWSRSVGDRARSVSRRARPRAGVRRCRPRGHALREVLDAYVDSSVAERSAGERVEQFLDTAARWDAFPDVAHRCVLLAFDAAMLSGDRSLVARCQAIHEQIQELTGEPPTWRVPMVEGSAQRRRGPPRRTAGRPPAVRRTQPVRGRRHADRRLRDALRRGSRCGARPCSIASLRAWVSTAIERPASTVRSVG